MDTNEPLQRLKGLQRDLVAFAETQLANVDRLSAEIDASIEDLQKIFEKKRKNDESRKKLVPVQDPKPATVKIQDIEYKINDDFRQAALIVADELDLDELEAAKLCVDAAPIDLTETDTTLPYRALLLFHDHRQTLLDCLRLLLQQAVDSDDEDDNTKFFTQNVELVIACNEDGQPKSSSSYWRKCADGLSEIESSLRKLSDHKQAMLMTGQGLGGDTAEAVKAQRLLLTLQHECTAAAMSYLIRGSHVKPEDFRAFLSNAASLESNLEISIQYLPILISGSAYFGAEATALPGAAHDLHNLFAAGPGQLQWKQPDLKAAATVCWLAEYNSRFADTLTDPALRVADRQKAEEDRSKLFFDSLKNRALHFLLAACTYLKPEVWHDPAKVGLVRFLLADAQAATPDSPPPSPHFSTLVMRELQVFTDAFVTNLPDILRRMKMDEDERRRNWIARPDNAEPTYEPDLERFMVIVSYAYQDDPDAAHDFWSDRESNLYGFLRWVSRRLPTPRVAAFCELLRSIATDANNADNAHRFLLEDTTVASGKLRKTYSVSWTQIFAEFETYASSLRDKPASQNGSTPGPDIIEPETHIMLEAYLRLASHICRVSPAARNWLLREQTFHLGETMIQLVSSATLHQIQASCFDMLSAMLTDKVPEVNDGMWAMLDSWLSAGSSSPSKIARPQAAGRPALSERHYLACFNTYSETATALVGLLTALITPSTARVEATLNALPFPENLGAPHRHAGIDHYVDFVIGSAFRTWASPSSGAEFERSQSNVLRCACLDFVCTALSTFNEDLILLANTSSLPIDSAIKTSSLAAYARLHPFARVMEWLFNNQVIDLLFNSLRQERGYELTGISSRSPTVQATLRGVEVMNLALKLQATYFDIVRPLVNTQSSPRSHSVANVALASFDEIVLSQLHVVADIASFAASRHVDLSLESLELLRKLGSFRKLNDSTEVGQTHVGNRLIGSLADASDVIAMELAPEFQIYEWDVETSQPTFKIMKANATLDMLNASLSASRYKPTIAHVLLGFTCHERSVEVTSDSLFGLSQSLFHAVAACAAQAPIAVRPTNISWLLRLKRSCLDVLLTLATSPLTSAAVRPELRSMEFFAALSKNQTRATESQLWDMKMMTDGELLLAEAALAVRDFFRIREAYFKYAALEIRSSTEAGMFSVQENVVHALLGKFRFQTGEDLLTLSIFDLFDFIELEIARPSDVAGRYLPGLDLSTCLKDDRETIIAYDLKIAEELLVLQKRELLDSQKFRDASDEQQVEDEVRATLASLLSQNNWRAIQIARVEALEAWTDLLSLMVTSSGLQANELAALALQGLQVVLPKFEKLLTDDLDSAALLAKVIVTLVPAAVTAEQAQSSADAAHERLLAAFRVCLKAVTDGNTDLALRDVCYRTCCSVLASLPLTTVYGQPSSSPHARRLIQLIQGAGERLLTVITEDAFSGRGVTRVSAVLFLDAVITLFQSAKASLAVMRALSKLNFIPVLIDASIGSVASSFTTENEELITTQAYFHTALALLLRICNTVDGAQLVLHSGFFEAIDDSRLFSTDPDIGLDIDNPIALIEFYRLLSAVLRVVAAIAVSRGPVNAAALQQTKSFLQQNRFSIQAVFKRTSAIQKTSGPPELEAMDVADEFAKLLLVTGFLEDDESAQQRIVKMSGFT